MTAASWPLVGSSSCMTRTALRRGTACCGWWPSHRRRSSLTSEAIRCLPEVGWSWLTGALADRAAAHRAAGGTVTQTTSTRFGDVHGPRTTVTLELRGSWTADSADLRPHLLAFADLLSMAAGLPPEGVAVLPTA